MTIAIGESAITFPASRDGGGRILSFHVIGFPVAPAFPIHFPRLPRLNGDTRRRKKRLRNKLAKLDDAIHFHSLAMRTAKNLLRAQLMARLERLCRRPPCDRKDSQMNVYDPHPTTGAE